MEETERTCGTCRGTKALSEFVKSRRGKNGHCRYCKECHRKNGLAYYRKKVGRPVVKQVKDASPESHRTCSKCGVTQEIYAFYRHKQSRGGYSTTCKVCHNANGKSWYNKNRDKRLNYQRKYAAKNRERLRGLTTGWSRLRRTGVTEEQYSGALREQDERCAICNRHQSELKMALCADHDHKTGAFRGLLCGKCNTAIGLLNDNPLLIQKALKYMEASFVEVL